MILNILALASALAGNLVSSKPDGGEAHHARFSLIVRSNDSSVPEWMSREQHELLGRQQSVIDPDLPPFLSKKPMRALRRQVQAMEALGSGNDLEAQMLRGFIDSEKRRKAYRFLLPVSGEGSGVRWTGKHPGGAPAVLVNGAADIRKILRGKSKDGSLWNSLGQGGQGNGSVLGWIDSTGLGKLWQQLGSQQVRCLGWQVECPASTVLPDTIVHPSLAASHLLRRLEVVRFGSTRFTFYAAPSDIELLNQQVSNVALRLEQLPEDLRAAAVPDTLLAWHLAALLSALCWDGRNAPDPQQVSWCVQLAVVLAEYVVAQHLHHFRQTFLADHPALLEGLDRRMARLLPGHPCGVRELQRKFHGVNKDECLASLNKLVALGLAEECAPGRFRQMPPSPPSLRLSDFLSVYGLETETAADGCAARTDNTDTFPG
ncbi:MAG: hypothetical protein ABIT37_19770 [Luteolibacter sp.]